MRDWLHVEDHCRAVDLVLRRGVPGETYNVGGRSEVANLDLVRRLAAVLDALRPRADGRPHAERIAFVADRPGHDRRYAIDCRKIASELGWEPLENLDSGLRRTGRVVSRQPGLVRCDHAGPLRPGTPRHGLLTGTGAQRHEGKFA